MLNTFKKFMDVLGAEYQPEHKPHSKFIYEFNDPNTQKHWMIFYAVYNAGVKHASEEFNLVVTRKALELIKT